MRELTHIKGFDTLVCPSEQGVTRRAVVHFEPQGKKVEVKLGLTLLDVATKAGIGIRSECGGLGVCGKCLVVVEDQSNLSPITDAEIRSVPSEKLKAGYRLMQELPLILREPTGMWKSSLGWTGR